MRRTAGWESARLGPELLEARVVPALIGGLDPSFGTGGAVLTDFGQFETGSAVALQPDGKVVVVGSTGLPGGSDVLVLRYNPDGTLDTSFNGTGKLTIDFNGGVDVGTAVAVQADGKIVVAGTSTTPGTPTPASGDFAVARLNPDGTLDTSFNGGKVNVNLTGHEAGTGVAVQPDGKVILVGSTNTVGGGAFAIVRLNTNGIVDPTFGGGDGLTTVDFGTGADAASAVVLQPDGKIVVAGSAAIGATPSDFAVVRLTTAGDLDTTFGTGGKQTIDFGLNDTAAAVALQPDGKVVVAGTTDAGSGQADFAVARLTTAGALDTAFHTTGKLTITFGKNETASGVAVAPDGRIVVSGTTNATGNGDMAVLRVFSNGNLDTSFGPNGQRTYDLGGVDAANAVAVTPTGRIVLAGTTGATDVAVARAIGTVEEGRNLAVSGAANGSAVLFAPIPNGSIYAVTPAANPAPIAGYTGTYRTAVADVNGDGVQDTVMVTGPGTAIRVAVVSGVDNSTLLVQPFDPFGGGFTGGGFVSAADLDNDGRAEFVVTPDQGGGPRVTIFSLLTSGLVTRANFFGIDDPNFRGGARAAVGDINGDGTADLAVSAGFLGGPRVAVFNGKTLFGTPTRLTNDFFAFPGTDAVTLRNGVFVAVGDVDGDGFADLIFGGGPGGAPRVFILSGKLVAAGNVQGAYGAPIANFFFAGLSSDRGGIRVAAKDVDLDGKADVAVGSGENVSSRARVYFGNTFAAAGGTSEPTGFQDLDPYNNAFLTGGVFVG